MENGVKAGKTQQANLTSAKLLTSFSLDQVSYKTEQKQGRFVNQMVHLTMTSWVNISSSASAYSPPKKELIKHYVKIWYTNAAWKGCSHEIKSFVIVFTVPLLPNQN